MATCYHKAVDKLVAAMQPASLLLIGPEARELFAPYIMQHPACTITQLSAEECFTTLPELGHYDFAFVSCTVENLPKADAEHLLAALRDVHAQRVVIALSIGAARPDQTSVWQAHELLALGLTEVTHCVEADATLHVYAFDINTYKTTPDWLSPRFWAHPELFDKYWW